MAPKEVQFFRLISKNRVNTYQLQSHTETIRVALYISQAPMLAKMLEIDTCPIKTEIRESELNDDSFLLQQLFTLEKYMLQIEVEHIYHLDPELSQQAIDLSEDWKQRVSTYISHIRSQIQKAEMIEGLREKIFDKLDELQREVDHNRTSLQRFEEIVLAVTEAGGKGAKNLDPAAKLISDMYRGAKRFFDDTPQIPSPTNYLEDLSDDTDDAQNGEDN